MDEFKIPDEFPKEYSDRFGYDLGAIKRSSTAFDLKGQWNRKGMFAFVAWEWVIPFVEWIAGRKCLEIMAGCGWLGKALREKNVDIIVTDDMSWHKTPEWKLVTEVENLEASEAVKKYGKDIEIIIISWPYMNDHAYKAIKELNYINTNCLIVYIGECEGGCTASENFFNHFLYLNDDKFDKATENFHSWWGIHDQLHLGRYKECENE